jgi:hypothetical protein
MQTVEPILGDRAQPAATRRVFIQSTMLTLIALFFYGSLAEIIGSPANAFEQWIEGWHLESGDLPIPLILLQTFDDMRFPIGISCSHGDRAIAVGPLEDSLPDDVTISYFCDGGTSSLPLNAHGYRGVYVAHKSNNIGTWSAVVAFPDTLLAAREKCSLIFNGKIRYYVASSPSLAPVI